MTVNDRSFEDYFPTEELRRIASRPLTEVGQAGKADITVRAVGGGENKAITSPDVVVSDALFGAFHPDKNDGEQVRIVVRLVIGSAAAEMQGVSTILQTSVTPQVLNQ